MHLLNVTTLKLETFLDENKRPPYAILSHTWLANHEEVSYQDLEAYHEALEHKQTAQANAISSRKGFKKIQGCCNIAYRCYNLKWAWVDTCCINKESSTELSEAINSMFKWYKTAAVCIVLLQDVQQHSQSSSNLGNRDNDRLQFRKSKWFTRGWTLQELLAPQQRLLFYDSQWQFIGDMKEDAQLCDIVSEITSIPVAFLTGAPLSEACVAKKMSWASERKTTRVEDIAYSLLGVFGVNMALLYGEGNRAFIRLQEEIINQTHDHSILAWGKLLGNHEHPFDSEYWKDLGAFAASPVDFKDCWDFERASGFLRYNDNLDFQITTAGIRLSANVFDTISHGLYLCQLSCFSWRRSEDCLCIMVKKCPLMERGTQKDTTILSQYMRAARILITDLDALDSPKKRSQTVTLAKSDTHSTVRSIEQHNQDTGVIFLDLPKGFGLETSYISPDFDFEVRPNKHRLLVKSSFRIVYSSDADVKCPSLPIYVSFMIVSFVAIGWIVVLSGVGIPSIFGIFLVFLFSIVASVLVIYYPEIWVLVWWLYRLLQRIGHSKINRDDVRVCLRITEPSQRRLGSDAKALILIICFWPRWINIKNAKRNQIKVLRKATLECYLSPVLTGGDVELNHPTGLSLSTMVYNEWYNSRWDKFYRIYIQQFSSTTHDKNPSLYAHLSEGKIPFFSSGGAGFKLDIGKKVIDA
ncbi:heterokaryon incompatibility protein-domain-containing protein [Xylaria cubensis]|nr:heterokaryon incompatibility protein-domain-containing protein [Xylaria cubensis]